MRRYIPGIIFIVVIIAGAMWVGPRWQSKISTFEVPKEVATPTPSENSFTIVRVVDGDTVEIDGGQIVRYIGVNTPETKDPRRGVQCFGKEAAEFNKQLVEGKKVRLEKDVSEKDKYGRLLRYVWVGDKMVNDLLVTNGYAQVATYPPDVKYKDIFLKSETNARLNKLGLWNKCK